jgi:hypothetical protein
MKRTLVFLIFFFSLSIVKSHGQAKVFTFEKAEQQGKSFQHLDSLYKSAVHSDTKLAVFKTQEEQDNLQKAYGKLLQDLGALLKKNNFKWENPTRCFNRIYFNSNGSIDYFLYKFANGQISAEKEKEFEVLLNSFAKDYKIGITAKERFAQCSPVKYLDN